MMLNYYNNHPVMPRWKRYWKTIAYADVYTCSPPKLFIPTMCLLQIAVWIYHEIYSSKNFLTPFNFKSSEVEEQRLAQMDDIDN
jgi:hypothetical protein